MRVVVARLSFALALLAIALLCVASPSITAATCGGDCSAELTAAPKSVERYAKRRWKVMMTCGKRGAPECPSACPVPDGTATPYLLSPTCATLVDCNLDALAATAYGATWDESGTCPLAPATACGAARAKNAGAAVAAKLKRRRTSKMDKFPGDLTTCATKIAKVVACDPALCADAGDWIDAIFPIVLAPEGFQTVPFSVATPGEGVATLTLAASGADWGDPGMESVVVGYDVDGTHTGTIVVYGGAAATPYRIMLGALDAGTHVLGLRHERRLSPAASSPVAVTAAASVESLAAPDARYDFTRFAPILLGIDTDLNPQNVVSIPHRGNAASDVPLIVYATAAPGVGTTTYRYTMIWSNEDGGTGVYPDLLIARYGRTTDIEGVLEADVSDGGVLTAVRYRPNESGTLATFAGAFQGTHPIIRTSTANGLIADDGASTFQFAIPPLAYDDTGLQRELGMDLEPISYAIMGKEMVREQKVESVGNAATKKLSDARNYLYIDYDIDVSLSDRVLRGVAIVGGVSYYSDHNQSFSPLLNPRVSGGIGRLAIELPPGTQLADIQQYGIQGIGTMTGTLFSADAFLLGSDYLPGPRLGFSGALAETGTNPSWMITP